MAPLILAFLLTLPVFHEDVGDSRKADQLAAIANAIAAVAETPEEAAMLIATGYAESTFGLRYHAGDCRGRECDNGDARGPWQVQKPAARLAWEYMTGIENTPLQARIALRKLRTGLEICQGRHQGALIFYMGNPALVSSNQKQQRIDLYEKALQALQR